ncbi:MAG: hypothetical protein ASARMPREDX12_006682 [Alectoria sarmentosa]|nr:MAG: hypothetical protein ASARMPREDX12_006682 [Alectoria sarmentosa]
MQIASLTAETQSQSLAEIVQTESTMSLPSRHLPERSNSSQLVPLLPAKAYVPPSSQQTSTKSSNRLIDAHVGHEAMPTEDEIKDATTKPRSSNTSTASTFASRNDAEKKGFLPLADLKEQD